jgi:prevent-host-death family protein
VTRLPSAWERGHQAAHQARDGPVFVRKFSQIVPIGSIYMQWRLADAKNRFSELVNLALSEGPQRVVRRKDAVFVVSERDFERLNGRMPTFKQFLLGTDAAQDLGLTDLDFEALDLGRDPSPMRENGI